MNLAKDENGTGLNQPRQLANLNLDQGLSLEAKLLSIFWSHELFAAT